MQKIMNTFIPSKDKVEVKTYNKEAKNVKGKKPFLDDDLITSL